MENQLNNNLTKELEELFSYVPPRQLRQSIHEVFARYLQTINEDSELEHFKTLAEDFYFLYKFLEKAEENQNS
jgi:hypothetical protein